MGVVGGLNRYQWVAVGPPYSLFRQFFGKTYHLDTMLRYRQTDTTSCHKRDR